ncbi:hypothetical protein [Candidatus Jidaibacter acanthamoebae]|uniref:hypothetical protein n=1 Tax=Candidatus Jidaibacter acanthamoebae TaxID=86105 RepID=UPI00057CE7C0|nr:hypothetical protein [Candidatus Jidaibacter acanthamoeba]MBA8667952.1 hypothetical protein [Holosporaceae bacterium 'Namur']
MQSALELIAYYTKEAIVYVDKSGIDSYLHRSFGWSKRGEPVYGERSGSSSSSSSGSSSEKTNFKFTYKTLDTSYCL